MLTVLSLFASLSFAEDDPCTYKAENQPCMEKCCAKLPECEWDGEMCMTPDPDGDCTTIVNCGVGVRPCTCEGDCEDNPCHWCDGLGMVSIPEGVCLKDECKTIITCEPKVIDWGQGDIDVCKCEGDCDEGTDYCKYCTAPMKDQPGPGLCIEEVEYRPLCVADGFQWGGKASTSSISSPWQCFKRCLRNKTDSGKTCKGWTWQEQAKKQCRLFTSRGGGLKEKIGSMSGKRNCHPVLGRIPQKDSWHNKN